MLKSRFEFPVGPLQCRFGIHLQNPRDIDENEQQVAYLVFDIGLLFFGDRLAKFLNLFLKFFKNSIIATGRSALIPARISLNTLASTPSGLSGVITK